MAEACSSDRSETTFAQAQDTVTEKERLPKRAYSFGEQFVEDVKKIKERRIILLGKVGAGKSASGNALLGQEIFESKASWDSVTRDCKYGIGERNGLLYRIFDTPGANAPSKDGEVFQNEIKRCLYVTSPGFHAIGLVISAAERLTNDDIKMLDKLDELLGEDASPFMILIFTKIKNKDKLDKLIGTSEEITKLRTKCNARYVCFGNDEDEVPAEYLREFDEKLNDLMVKNATVGKIHYQHKLYDKAQSILEKDCDELQKKRPELQRSEAFEIVRELAAAGRSPRDSELVKLAAKSCLRCIIM